TRSKRDWSSDVCSSDLKDNLLRLANFFLGMMSDKTFKNFSDRRSLKLGFEPVPTMMAPSYRSSANNLLKTIDPMECPKPKRGISVGMERKTTLASDKRSSKESK